METALRRGAEISQTPGSPLHMHWPITVASFRTWRGSRDYIARDPAPDISILTSDSGATCWEPAAFSILLGRALGETPEKNEARIHAAGDVGKKFVHQVP